MSQVSGFPPLRLLPLPFAHRAALSDSQHGPESARGPPGALRVVIPRGQVRTPFEGVRWEQKVHTPLLTFLTHSEIGTPSLS